MDLATKVYDSAIFTVEYAVKHLREASLPAGSYCLHVVGLGKDEQSGQRIPDCHAAFQLNVKEHGGLDVIPKTLDECGFRAS